MTTPRKMPPPTQTNPKPVATSPSDRVECQGRVKSTSSFFRVHSSVRYPNSRRIGASRAASGRSFVQELERQKQRQLRNVTHVPGRDVEVDLLELAILTPNAMASIWRQFPFVFRIGDHGTGNGPPLLHEVCLERGWKEYEAGNCGEDPESWNRTPFLSSTRSTNASWNFWWSLSNGGTNSMTNSWQVTNRITRNFSYTSKDTCTRYFRRLRNTYGDIFDLCPLTFNVPSEYAKLCMEHTKRKSRAFWTFWDRAHYIGTPVHKPIDLESQPIWICKPVGKSQGKGISVFDTVTNLSYNRRSVVQEYITRPLLIGPYKWDLRIYVAIVSLHPLVFYAYREGLVRFATLPFDLKNLQNTFAHLTNSSLNKQSPAYYQNKSGIGRGCKWSLCKLRHYFREKGIHDWTLWQRIGSILILTIIGDAPAIVKKFEQEVGKSQTFFLMGFDILVDRTLRPLLIEVNSNPSLSNDCEVDRIVKKKMLHDLFDLLNLPEGRGFESHWDSNPIIYAQSPTHPIKSRKGLQEEDDLSSEDGGEEDVVTSSLPNISSIEQLTSSGQRSSVSDSEINQSEINSDQTIPCIQHIRGPGYHEVLQMSHWPNRILSKFGYVTKAESKVKLSETETRSTPTNYPIVITLPVQRQIHRLRSLNLSCQPAGLMLKPPNWGKHAPAHQGNWVRLFPFNEITQRLSSAENSFDVKDAVRQVQELIKFSNQLQISEGDDTMFDAMLMDKLQLTTPPWHPPLGPGKRPRF